MQCVKLIAKGAHVVHKTLDEKMLEIQERKSKNIQGILGSVVYDNSASLEEFLECFGEVTKVDGGGFKITKRRSVTSTK